MEKRAHIYSMPPFCLQGNSFSSLTPRKRTGSGENIGQGSNSQRLVFTAQRRNFSLGTDLLPQIELLRDARLGAASPCRGWDVNLGGGRLLLGESDWWRIWINLLVLDFMSTIRTYLITFRCCNEMAVNIPKKAEGDGERKL